MKIHCILLVVLASLFIQAAETRAQAIEWKEISGTAGFEYLQLGEDGRIFSALGNVLYVSDDDGVSWTKTLTAQPTLNQFVSRNRWSVFSQYNSPQRKFEFLLSSDNGASWTFAFREPRLRDLAHYYFMISDSGTLYSIDESLLISRFNGVSWESGGQAPPVSVQYEPDTRYTFPVYLPSLVTAIRGSTILIGTPGYGFTTTTDFGVTWTRYLDNKYVSAFGTLPDGRIVIACNYFQVRGELLPRKGGVYVLSADGLSVDLLGLEYYTFNNLAVGSDGSIVAATTSGMYRRGPGDSSWSLLGVPSDAVTRVYISSANTIICTSPNIGIYRSIDNGFSWYSNNIYRKNIFTLISPEAGTIYAGTFGQRVYRTTTGGAGWYQSPEGSVNNNVYSMAISGPQVFAGTEDGVYVSTDQGVSWSNCTQNSFSGAAYSIVSAGSGTIFAGTNFGVYRSTDAGVNWSVTGLQDEKIFCLTSDRPIGGHLYASGESGRIMGSSDNGLTWSQTGPVRNDIQTLIADSSGRIIAGVYGGVLVSPNYGASWITSGVFTNTWVNGLVFRDRLTVFAATDNGIYQSLDGGFTWSQAGLPGSQVISVCIDPENTLIAGVYGTGIFATTKSITAVKTIPQGLPSETALISPYPNPFNSSTTISFTLRSASFVSLKVYDLLGREVAVLVDDRVEAGIHRVRWDAPALAGGTYFCRMQTGAESQIRKILIIR